MARPVIFLDRDGTLNVDTGFVHRPEEWQFTNRAPEALRELRAAGYAIALVTNQSGIARGYFTPQCVQTLHRFVQQQLAEDGAALDAIAICPHGPDDGCACRKPCTGMVQQIEEQLADPIAYERSWTIGDKISDLQFGRALGTRVALLRSRYWHEGHQSAVAALIADSLYQAAQAILARDRL
jgi:D-glycero-D-manno-heptose 1,7-bisphosphate phosphatase